MAEQDDKFISDKEFISNVLENKTKDALSKIAFVAQAEVDFLNSHKEEIVDCFEASKRARATLEKLIRLMGEIGGIAVTARNSINNTEEMNRLFYAETYLNLVAKYRELLIEKSKSSRNPYLSNLVHHFSTVFSKKENERIIDEMADVLWVEEQTNNKDNCIY